MPGLVAILLTLASISDLGRVAAAEDLLPDIIVDKSYLFDWDIVNNIEPGRTHLRLSNGTANVGAGPLHLFGVEPGNPDGTQDVMQRVYRDDGTYYDRLAGQFVYHPEHGHIHFENWGIYRLREVVDTHGVGDIVAEGSKTSFCILDLAVYNENLVNFDPDGQYFNCGSQIQGLSVGWIDIYSLGLPGQNIDITGVPDGDYWLESVVDPRNDVLERKEDNNTSRIKISIGIGGLSADSYEPNDSSVAVDDRPAGGPNSPNLGPCSPVRTITDLSIHAADNDDWFKYYSPASGLVSDSVYIDFTHAQGDVDMQLYDSELNLLATSETTNNHEMITLLGRAAGWYYVRVFGYNGATNPDYTLSVDPPANSAPSVTPLAPLSGDTSLIHGFETFTATWSFSDPEANTCWVSVYVNTSPVLDGNEELLPTSLHTDAEQGFYIVNTSYLEENQTYYAYFQITDGGATSGAWAGGTLTITAPPDVDAVAGHVTNSFGNPISDAIIMIVGHHHMDTTNSEGWYSIHSHEPGDYEVMFMHPDYVDTVIGPITVVPLQTLTLDVMMEVDCPFPPDSSGTVCCCVCPSRGNVDGSAECGATLGDLTALVDHLFISLAPLACPMAGNLDLSQPEGDGSVTLADLTLMVDHLFISLAPLPSCP